MVSRIDLSTRRGSPMPKTHTGHPDHMAFHTFTCWPFWLGISLLWVWLWWVNSPKTCWFTDDFTERPCPRAERAFWDRLVHCFHLVASSSYQRDPGTGGSYQSKRKDNAYWDNPSLQKEESLTKLNLKREKKWYNL